MMLKFRPMLVLTALSMLVLAVPGAEAAPQALGLVASNGVLTPLRCDGGLCSGVVGSFCLQFARPAPDPDSDYRLAEGGGITLVGERADGSALRLSADSLVAIRSRMGFSSVTVSVPDSELKAMGVVKAALEIAPLTSVLPVAVAGDSDPETPGEIAQALGPERRLARSTFEAPGESGDAVRVVTLVINSLPAREPTSAVGREAAWRAAVSQAAGAALDPQGLVVASRIYRDCGTAVDAGASATLGACMERAEQGLIGTLEFDFEGQSGAGQARDDTAGGS